MGNLVPPDEAIALDGQRVGIIGGQDPNGIARILLLDPDGTLRLVDTDPMLNIARGLVSGVSHINKFGMNKDVTKNVEEDIWLEGGTYSFPGTADITHIRQDTDDAGMRGENVQVEGLDVNWDVVTQTVTLDASDTTTPVALGTALIRVYRMEVRANVVAAQKIELRNVGGTTTYATIDDGDNQTLMAIYSVPADVTAYITNYYANQVLGVSGTKDPARVDHHLRVADRANAYEFQVEHERATSSSDTSFEHFFTPPLKVTEKSDIKISSTPSNDKAAQVHAGFDVILVEN